MACESVPEHAVVAGIGAGVVDDNVAGTGASVGRRGSMMFAHTHRSPFALWITTDRPTMLYGPDSGRFES